jgi:hypothetical protein
MLIKVLLIVLTNISQLISDTKIAVSTIVAI